MKVRKNITLSRKANEYLKLLAKEKKKIPKRSYRGVNRKGS